MGNSLTSCSFLLLLRAIKGKLDHVRLESLSTSRKANLALDYECDEKVMQRIAPIGTD